ncbi:MAG: GYD domain-containing protein [Acidimicrobiales bacterium]
MAKFVMLSTLGPDGSATLREKPERIKQVNGEVEAMGGHVLHQYALLGQWDFVTIIEAPDELTMARIATELTSRGTLKTRTLVAIEVDDLIRTLQEGREG